MTVEAKAVLAIWLLLPCSALSASSVQDDAKLWPGQRWEKANRGTYVGINEFSQCIVDSRPADVERVLLLPADSSEAAEAVRDLASGSPDCLTIVAVRMPERLFRGALVEALYRRDFQKKRSVKMPVRLGEESNRLKLAKCIVRDAFAKSDELLTTLVASPAQTKIFRDIEPTVKACSVETQQAVPYPERLRQDVAEALYRARSSEIGTVGSAQ